jgi:hypothetical protein
VVTCAGSCAGSCKHYISCKLANHAFAVAVLCRYVGIMQGTDSIITAVE